MLTAGRWPKRARWLLEWWSAGGVTRQARQTVLLVVLDHMIIRRDTVFGTEAGLTFGTTGPCSVPWYLYLHNSVEQNHWYRQRVL